MPSKIPPITGEQAAKIASLRKRIPELQRLITDKMRMEVLDALAKRAFSFSRFFLPSHFVEITSEQLRTFTYTESQILSCCSVYSRHLKNGCIYFFRHSTFSQGRDFFSFLYVFLEMTYLASNAGGPHVGGLPPRWAHSC